MDPGDRSTASALEESAEDLYEHAPCGYLSTLPDGGVVRVNETFLRWTGYARDELVGRRRFVDLLTPGGRIYHETHYAPLLQMQHAVREIALEIVCADGRRLPVLVNSVLRNDADGRPLAIRTTIFDATDRKRYERELLRTRELERAARRRTDRLQRVTTALAAVLEPPQIAAAVIAAIIESSGARHAVLAVSDGEDEAAVLGSHGAPAEALDAWSRGAPLAEPDVAEALRSGAAVFSAQAAVLPLVLAGRTLGLVALEFAAPVQLADEDRELLVAMVRQAAQAVERARLHEQTAAAAQRLALLAEASHALNAAPRLAERAQLLADLLVPRLTTAARVDIADDSGLRTIAVAAVDEAARERLGAERSRTVLALRVRERTVGTLVLAAAREHAPDPDPTLLAELAERAALALENARLYEREHRIAHAMQQSLLAGEPPRDPRFEVATRYEPGVEALAVGGDWHDAFRIGADRLWVVVGDVVGRGLEAASAMGQLRSALRSIADGGTGPAAVLDRLERFVEQFDVGRAATVAIAEVDLATGDLRYACAGHPPPLLAQPGVAPELLWDGRSPPLGAFGDVSPRGDAGVRLRPGARLLLCTDGLVERRGRAMDAGLDALVAEVGRRRSAEPQRLVDELVTAMVEPQDAKDDVCLLCLALAGGAA